MKFVFSKNTSFPKTTAEDESSNMEINFSIVVSVLFSLPNSTFIPCICHQTVTMQAQREIPEDMVCKDKFLIQGTVVPAETTSDEVTSSLVWIFNTVWFGTMVDFLLISIFFDLLFGNGSLLKMEVNI